MCRRGNKRLWRPLIAVVVAYALAAQSLLITVGGFAALAHADTGAAAFVLCAHNSDGAPVRPADAPIYPGCNQCIFCFAGSHQALIATPAILAQPADVTLVDVALRGDARLLPRHPAYLIAHPRGPPLRA